MDVTEEVFTMLVLLHTHAVTSVSRYVDLQHLRKYQALTNVVFMLGKRGLKLK